MTKLEISNALGQALAARGLSYRHGSRLMSDLGLDSYALVALIMEVEGTLGAEFDDAAQALFAEAPLAEICARLAP